MSKVKEIFDVVKTFAVKNAPSIMTGVGIVGSVSALVMGIKATPKAMQNITETRARRVSERYANVDPTNIPEKVDDSISFTDYVKAVAPVYWPCATTELLALSCIFFSNKVNLKRQAALLAAYQLSETNLKDYQQKMLETFGEKKSNEVKDKVAKKRVNENPPDDKQIIFTGSGDTLCYDSISGRYFHSNIEKIRQVINDINRRLLVEDSVCVNEFYEEIGLPSISMGDILGWNGARFGDAMEVHFSSQLTDMGEPCLVLDYEVIPSYGSISSTM